jgi:enterochelin esterase-like enzyme
LNQQPAIGHTSLGPQGEVTVARVDGCKSRARTILLGLFLLAGCAAAGCRKEPASGGADPAPSGKLVYDRLQSEALRGNLLETPSERSVIVYLPPSYGEDSQRRYPVLYFLHGITSTNTDFAGGQEKSISVEPELNRLIGDGTIREMIVVLPDARTRFGGAFYTNSTVAGDWEDFIVRDLVGYVDARYRTLARPESRGVAGHSMGGYGAIKLAMKHPHVFSAAYALSPACLAWAGDLTADNPAWAKALALKRPEDRAEDDFYSLAFLAMATSFSPNPERPPFFADWPFVATEGGLKVDEVAHAKWSAEFPVPLLERYSGNVARLRGLRFDVGKGDQFSHIPAGCRLLSRALTERGISHSFEEYDGDHNSRIWERLWTKVMPFFSETLSFEGR